MTEDEEKFEIMAREILALFSPKCRRIWDLHLLGKKNKDADVKEKEMSFWEHLEELRWNLLRSIIAVFVLAIVAFLNRSIIFDLIILAPKDSDFITNRLLCQRHPG